MRFFLIFFLLFGCSENTNSYFPLGEVKSWFYKVEIQPEIEKKTIYKKINLLLKKKVLKINGEKKSFYPLLREDGSVFFYQSNDEGVYRIAYAFSKDKTIRSEKQKRMVLPASLKIGDNWSVNSKTFLILKRYPYYDYRATTNFEIKYEIISKTDVISTPVGKFNNCLLVRGIGKTNFIGDSEIGSIKINITSEEWYAKGVGLIKSVRTERTDSDLFGTTKMTQTLESFKK